MRTVIGASVVLIALASAPAALAAGEAIGQIKTVGGQAFVQRGAGKVPARPGDMVMEKDVLETGADGSIGVTFVDNSVFSAGPNSLIALDEFNFDSTNFKGAMMGNVRKGTLAVVSGDIARSTPGGMKIRTPTAIMGVRGTTFAVQVIEAAP